MKIKAFVSIILLLLALGIGGWLDYQDEISKPLVINQSVTIEIIKGESFSRITEKLSEQQLPISPFWFKVLALQKDAFKLLKTGEYELAKGLNAQEILALLVSGKTKHYTITFPEGWCFEQIWQEIAKNQYLDHTLINPDPSVVISKLGAAVTHPEGELFPDTYFFEKHTSDIDLLQRAYSKMQTVIGKEWQHKAENLPYKNLYEALIMASIVEKETGVKSERAMIAGVFVRRLQLGMRLQTDPTVIYGIGKDYNGDITYKHLKNLTPFNTYMITGLPPTPIAMPGRDAIHAALHPAQTENLYFVANGDGSHVFSANLKAHNEAVNNFLRKKK